MTKEKQIEEMALAIHGVSHLPLELCGALATDLAEIGYRKPSEGEWMQTKTWDFDYRCSVCGELAPENRYGNFSHTTKFCPHCGAKMKGGAE